MASYLQVGEAPNEETVSAPPNASAFLGSRSRWAGLAVAAFCGISCLVLALRQEIPSNSLQVGTPRPTMEVAKEMGVVEFIDLFLEMDESQIGQSPSGSNSTRNSVVKQVKRQLQDMTTNPLALPIASCTVDSYLVASFIGILGNIINGAVKSCKRADKTKKVFKRSIFKDLLPNIDALISPDQKIVIQDLLDQGCRIGIESAVSIVSFIVGFLARAVNDCAMAISPPVPNPPAACAADMALVTAGVSFLTAGAETAQAVCPPYPKNLDFDVNVEALDIADGISRRLQLQDRNFLEAKQIDDVKEVLIKRLPALGPIASTILNNKAFFKMRRRKRKNQARTDKLIKCGFDVAGLVGFTAAVGVFLTAGTMECPLAVGDSEQAQGLKMGCSLDISAVIAALTSVAGFVGILATECPENPHKPAVNICVTAGFNLVSSLGFLSGGLSDAVRMCGA